VRLADKVMLEASSVRMSLSINTNISSLNAQRNLISSRSALGTALQRLSSGLRINSAADDAAGLAIADRFTTQIRGKPRVSRGRRSCSRPPRR
jgi:flagellin